MAKFLTHNGGNLVEAQSVGTSAGAGDAGKLVHLDGAGRFPTSVMPAGIGADTKSLTASEALSAGDFVNIWDDAGTPKARKADASAAGKKAHGYVVAAVSSGASAEVYFEGANAQVSGLTAGDVYLSATTAGAATNTAPSGTGKVVQRLGTAVAATEINVELGPTIELA